LAVGDGFLGYILYQKLKIITLAIKIWNGPVPNKDWDVAETPKVGKPNSYAHIHGGFFGIQGGNQKRLKKN
jgi:hypothetical protein